MLTQATRNHSLLATFLAALLLCSSGLHAGEEQRWHVMSMDGVSVGSIHETMQQDGEQTIVTEEVLLVLNRLGSKLEMRTFQRSVEDSDGYLRRVRLETTLSEQTMLVEGYPDGDEWVTVAGGEGVPERRRRLDEPLLGPTAIRARLASLKAPGDQVAFPAFIASTGQPGVVRAELSGFEEVAGERLRVTSQHLPELPVPMSVLLDAAGRQVITRMPGPFGVVETVLADETAARLANAGGELRDEVFRATLLETGVRLPAPRDIEYLELELSHRNPTMGWPELTGAGQQVLESSPERLVLAVNRTRPSGSFVLGTGVDEQHLPFLEANAMLQVQQPELLELARDIVGDERDAWAAARLLERWVADNMSFDMGVVLAPSSEVLENRRGTCSEYAILLTTLARALGLPARYVTGYVYAHGMFGGHAWTQVLIGDQWVALDAAIPAEGPADAARFAFLWSSLNDGAGALSGGPGLQMYGQIDARVLAWQNNGAELQRYADGAPSAQLVDGRFQDAVQGIEWAPAADWSIVDYQQTWPSTLVAAAKNDNGGRVELHWRALNPWESAAEPASGAECCKRVEQHYPGRGGYWHLSAESAEQLDLLAAGLVLPSS